MNLCLRLSAVIATLGLAPLAAWAETPAITGPATVESFTRGQQGEPFTVTAHLQGCGDADGFNGCIFYADGWRYAAAQGAGSNQAAMDLLAKLPVNTRFTVEGDLVFYGDVTAEVLISRITPAEAPDPYADLRAAIQGEWVSTDDKDATLSITGSEETSLYAGEPSGYSILNFTDFCEDSAAPGGPFLTAREMQSADGFVLCYAVESITADRMLLMYLPRGNFLEYVRP